jgi:hypothetical protein
MSASARTYNVLGMGCQSGPPKKTITSHTTDGALPPSSKTHGLRYLAASAAIILATRSLPVNLTIALVTKYEEMAESTHCNLPDCTMGDNFCRQRRDALNGCGHEIENAWGKASLFLISATTMNSCKAYRSRTSCRASTMREDVYGQYSEGRTTTVLPHTRGTAAEVKTSGMGTFHGTTEYLRSRSAHRER